VLLGGPVGVRLYGAGGDRLLNPREALERRPCVERESFVPCLRDGKVGKGEVNARQAAARRRDLFLPQVRARHLPPFCQREQGEQAPVFLPNCFAARQGEGAADGDAMRRRPAECLVFPLDARPALEARWRYAEGVSAVCGLDEDSPVDGAHRSNGRVTDGAEPPR